MQRGRESASVVCVRVAERKREHVCQQITRGIVEGKGKSLDCVVEVERGKKRRAKWLMKGSTMHVVDTILCVSWLLNLLHLTYESENNASAWAYEVFFFFYHK